MESLYESVLFVQNAAVSKGGEGTTVNSAFANRFRAAQEEQYGFVPKKLETTPLP
jgi:hypothetical protein